MSYYRIVEWETYQHYKDRDPPWIKLHRDTLTSRTWVSSSDADRVLAVACMLIAAGTDNKIPADLAFVKRRAYLNREPDFTALVAMGFLEKVNEASDIEAGDSASKQTLANDTEHSSEKRREETEEEERAFSEFVEAARKHGWPKPQKLDAERRKKLRKRLDEHGIVEWRTMLAKAAASDFLCSKFALKFDWVIEPKNFTKVIEGNYDAKPQGGANGSAVAREDNWSWRMDKWRQDKFWPSTWGPEPGKPGCFVPREFLQ